jgi:hypothetical protein
MPNPDEFLIPKDLIAVRFRVRAFSRYSSESKRAAFIPGLRAGHSPGSNPAQIGANQVRVQVLLSGHA